MNPYLILREDIRSHWISFSAFSLMIGLTLSFTLSITSLERAFQESTKKASAPLSLIAVPPGNKYAQLMQFAFLKPSQMELLSSEDTSELLAQKEHANYVSPLGFGDNFAGYSIVGVSPNFIDLGGQLSFDTGRRFSTPFEAVVGARVKLDVGENFSPVHGDAHTTIDLDKHDYENSRLHTHVHDEHCDHGPHQAIKYSVVGKLEERGTIWDYAILVPIETVWKLHGLPMGHKPQEHFHDLQVGPPYDPLYTPGAPAVVYGFSKKHLAQASKVRYIYNAKEHVDVFAPAEILLDVYKYLGDSKKLLLVISYGAIVIVLLSIFLSLIASLESFAPKLMLLRVLGAPRSFVFLTVWLKSVIMTMSGVIIGLMGSVILAKLMASWMTTSTYLALYPTIGCTEIYVIVGVFTMGCLGATVPAIMVVKKSPANVLQEN